MKYIKKENMAGKIKAKGLDIAPDAAILRQHALDHVWIHNRPWDEVSAPGGLLIFAEGKGCRITDIDGKSYLDGFAGLMYKNVGYGRKEIADAAYAQMLKLTSMSGFQTTIPAIQLATKLAEITPGNLSKTFFVCGGSEANEVALRIAKKYQRLSGFGNRYKFIVRWGEYHGATHATMSIGKAPGRAWADYEPLVPGVLRGPQPYCYRCEFNLEYPDCGVRCAKEIERLIELEGPDTIAGFIATSVCQSAGVLVPPPEYWPKVRSICDKHGILLIDDEVVMGFGRTGKMFGIEHWDVVPDIMTVAKGLSSGYLPVGACIATTEVAEKFMGTQKECLSGPITFGGLPACCAAALANIDIIEGEKLVENAAAMGKYFLDKSRVLYQRSIVGDIRGIGLVWDIELVKDRKTKERFKPEDKINFKINAKLREAGFTTRVDPAGGIRFLPPLVFSRNEIDESIAIIDKVISEVESEL